MSVSQSYNKLQTPSNLFRTSQVYPGREKAINEDVRKFFTIASEAVTKNKNNPESF